ncbi:MAG TPA: metallophosphoesterase, partial [Cellvibrio sp.]|nr:metallophosphoesterase [Cellvibrio sp.]
MAQEKIKVAAVGDLHCTKSAAGQLRPLFAQAAEMADMLLLCGDLTDYGLAEEAEVLAGELAVVKKMPVVAVLGNHDYESGSPDEVKRVLTEAGVRILDGDAVEIEGIGIAGVKGFAGGYGRHALG